MTPRVAIIGAGPAGISAALWLDDLKVPFVWLEQSDRVGGTLHRVGNPIPNYPGISASSGPSLLRELAANLHAAKLAPTFGAQVTGISYQRTTECWTLRTTGNQHTVDAVLVCTGTRPRRLGLPREQELSGVEVSVNHNLAHYAGQSVAVVGGGDAAVEGALILATRCAHVHVIHRRDRFRAQQRFVERIKSHANVTLHCSQEVTTLNGAQQLTSLGLSDGTTLAVTGLFIRIGVEAAIVPGLTSEAKGSHGFLTADATGRTPLNGLYVAGDVGAPEHQSVAWAVGSAARATRAITNDLGITR